MTSPLVLHLDVGVVENILSVLERARDAAVPKSITPEAEAQVYWTMVSVHEDASSHR